MENKETILSLNSILKLNAKGNEQDWAIEYSDKNRLYDFISIFENAPLQLRQKQAVLSLIIASYDDFLFENRDSDSQIWNKIEHLLNQNAGIVDDTLNYWAQWNENENTNHFNVTSRIRMYLTNRARVS
ncbi:MAG TPA: hypothetical protein VMR70_20545 [Flavisolibacter sp.]|nr:hypothetical protein [Flavisolibacter sp.]